MNIEEMNLSQIEKRIAEISKLSEDEKTKLEDLEILGKEVDVLELRRAEIKKDVETRKSILDKVSRAKSNDPEVREVASTNDIEEKNKMDKKEFDYTSVEYRNAYLKKLMGRELSEVEERAYVHTTGNTGAVVPKDLENKIYTNMEEAHPILKDVNVLKTGTVISIAKHVAIVEGDAAIKAEGVANTDEKNTFVNVTLAGKFFTKHADISYQLAAMSIPAFEDYLAQEIGSRLGAAMAKEIVDQIKKDANATNKFEAATPGKLALEDFLKGLGALKATGRVFVYVNNTTLYNKLAAVEGDAGRISFVGNFQDDVAATLLGKGIKEEDAVADNEILLLDPKQFTWNEVKGITFEQDRDIKKGVKTIAGHAIAEGTLTNDKAAVILSVGAAA